jgi:5-methylcytosine-specific restriction endonuclease McrA
MCQDCLERDGALIAARFVHHVKPVRDYLELAFDLDNLRPLCAACHNRREKAK